MRALFIAITFLMSFGVYGEEIVFTLLKMENARILKNDILEIHTALPEGTVVSVPGDIQPETHLYRLPGGRIDRSSNGFFPHLKILAVSSEHERTFSQDRINSLNQLSLWITATAVPLQTEGNFPGQDLGQPNSDYLSSFEDNGKPRFNFSDYYKNRFPKRLNLFIDPKTQSEKDRTKWQLIMKELALAADRTVETENSYLFIPLEEAKAASIAYEKKNEVISHGAWTIAVKSTAPRHGFGHVPCAEFMSEMIKQAYKRAGYDVFEDFNDSSKTRLSWNSTSAVVNLTNTLYKVGWIPWELSNYRPPIGAIMAHSLSTTPGHVYIAAGYDGRLIVDNSSPAGRHIYRSTDKVIKMMYYGGVFFLPPGIAPLTW